MILALADDLSGAAEIAGLAQNWGLNVQLVDSADWDPSFDVVVLDTNSRSLAPEKAAERLLSLVPSLTNPGITWVFKKIDSVLRGPVLSEVDALMQSMKDGSSGPHGTLLVAGNPSQNRVIRDGHLWVDGVRIHESLFAGDPEHPASRSDVLGMLGAEGRCDVRLIPLGHDVPEDGISVAESATLEELDRLADATSGNRLSVGAAQFFEACLKQRGIGHPPRAADASPPLPNAPLLLVCGSREAAVRQTTECDRHTIPQLTPETKRSTSIPFARAMLSLGKDRLDHPPQRLVRRLADSAADWLRSHPDASVIIEGGETASTLLRVLDPGPLEVAGSFARGIVAVRRTNRPDMTRRDGRLFVIKPGSYAWPQSLHDWFYGCDFDPHCDSGHPSPSASLEHGVRRERT